MNTKYSSYHLYKKGEEEIYRYTYLLVCLSTDGDPGDGASAACGRGGGGKQVAGDGVGGRILTVFPWCLFNFRTI